MTEVIQLVAQPRRDLAVVKFHAPANEIGTHISAAFGTVAQHLARNGIQVSGPAIAKYTMRDGGFDVSAGFAVPAPIKGDDKVVADALPECDAAVTTHIGGYDSLAGAYHSVRDWITSTGQIPGQTMWDEYLSEPSTPPAQTRTNIIWPVKSV